jgi:hypothetical protein
MIFISTQTSNKPVNGQIIFWLFQGCHRPLQNLISHFRFGKMGRIKNVVNGVIAVFKTITGFLKGRSLVTNRSGKPFSLKSIKHRFGLINIKITSQY